MKYNIYQKCSHRFWMKTYWLNLGKYWTDTTNCIRSQVKYLKLKESPTDLYGIAGCSIAITLNYI